MQMHTTIGGQRQSREGIERALTHHQQGRRVTWWTRAMRPHESGHRIGLAGGGTLVTHSLRETAIAALVLASAELGSRPRTMGELAPAERRKVAQQAMAQIGAELKAAAPQISAILDVAETGELTAGKTVIRADDSSPDPLTGRVTGWATRDHKKVYVLLGSADTATAESCGKLAELGPAGPRYRAHITPEAWQRDQAVEVDAPGPQDWDCTAYTQENLEYLARLEWTREDDGSLLDTDDVFKDDPAAPGWVRAWQGPFTIRVRRQG